MQGYQAKKINAQEVVSPKVKEDTSSSKEKVYAVRNRELFNQAVKDRAGFNPNESGSPGYLLDSVSPATRSVGDQTVSGTKR